MHELVESTEFHLADNVFVKSGLFKSAGSVIPQHSHTYEHNTFLATGSLLAWCDGVFMGEFHAPCAILIKAECKHTFETLEDNTLIYCIHNIAHSGDVDVHELHELTI